MPDQLPNIIHELSIYSIDFKDKLISTISNQTINKISITNKKYNTPILDIIKKIQNINPKLDIIPYYSLKYHQGASLQITTMDFISYLEAYKALSIEEVLLISGVAKSKYNTIQVLDMLRPIYKSDQYPKIAVAYNPFLTGVNLKIENDYIKSKIQSGIIYSVYLQIGIDLKIIQESIQYLRQLQPNLDIYISLINPTPTRLAQFNYRPWKGVYLPQEYLHSSTNAIAINKSIYNLAKKLNFHIIQGE
ncbi:MAG: hypothetical protein ACO3UU_02510 [Minisyncoccia bacterium]